MTNPSYNVLAPGPVNLHPKVKDALALPMIHHRTPEFDQILKKTLHKLKNVFQTQEPVFILTSTGSGGMEALLVNVMKPGSTVLVVDSGKFGERWAEMVPVFHGHLHVLKVEWGQAVTWDAIESYLKKYPEIDIVMTQACETSTGVLHPIKKIGQNLNKNYPDKLFLVDGITALGAMNLPMDEWKIDGLVGGSQKAFMLPTGLSFVALSQKAWRAADNNPTPRFYFDLRKEKKANEKGETFFSSNVTLIRALHVALDLMLENGLEPHFAQITERAALVQKYAPLLGFKAYTDHPSTTVTALKVPEGLNSQEFRELLEKQFHITIMGGQDQAKGKIIRIGHMGHITDQQQLELLKNLSLTLDLMKPTLKSHEQFLKLEKEIRIRLGL